MVGSMSAQVDQHSPDVPEKVKPKRIRPSRAKPKVPPPDLAPEPLVLPTSVDVATNPPKKRAPRSKDKPEPESKSTNETKPVVLPFSMTNPRENFIEFLLKQPTNQLSELQVRDIEIGIFNFSLKKAEEQRIPRTWNNSRFIDLYNSKARSIAANLVSHSYVSNERLMDRIKDNEFIPHEVVTMSADRLCPERWQTVIEAKIRHDEYISTAKPTAMTDQFLCGRCKKRECAFMELQTRSCDEPASIFVSCLSCGHRWRMG